MAGLTNAHVDASGAAFPDSQGAAWSDLTTWTAWTYWDANPYTSIEYVHETDVGAILPISLTVSVSCECDSYTVTESHSDDAVTWTSYAALGVPFLARYVRIKVVATGDYPILNDVIVSLLSERRDEIIPDLDISTLTGAHRIGTGDVRLPIVYGFSSITAVIVTLQNVGAGWTWELIDKNTATGPRIKVYDNTGTLADCTIDALIRGA